MIEELSVLLELGKYLNTISNNHVMVNFTVYSATDSVSTWIHLWNSNNSEILSTQLYHKFEHAKEALELIIEAIEEDLNEERGKQND